MRRKSQKMTPGFWATPVEEFTELGEEEEAQSVEMMICLDLLRWCQDHRECLMKVC